MDEVQQVEPLATCRVSTVSLHVPFTLVPTRSEAMDHTWTYVGPSSRPHDFLVKLENGGEAASRNFLGSNNMLLDDQHGFFARGK